LLLVFQVDGWLGFNGFPFEPLEKWRRGKPVSSLATEWLTSVTHQTHPISTGVMLSINTGVTNEHLQHR